MKFVFDAASYRALFTLGAMTVTSLVAGLRPRQDPETETSQTTAALDLAQSAARLRWQRGLDLISAAVRGEFVRCDDPDKIAIRHIMIPNQHAHSCVVLIPGFAENFGKYAEMVARFHEDGYEVFMLNHRGMGFSDRYPQPLHMPSALFRQTVHIKKFDDYVLDLEYFIKHVVRAETSLDLYAFSHSTGGLILANVLAKNTDLFKSAVLSAPLFRLPTNFVQELFLDMEGTLFEGYWPPSSMQATWNVDTATFEAQNESDDPERFYLYLDYLKDHRDVVQAQPSRQWLNQIRAQTTEQKLIELAINIKTPLMIFQAGRDFYVNDQGQDYFCAKKQALTPDLPLQFIRYDQAFHSIHRGKSHDEQYAAVTRFFAENRAKAVG